MRIMQRNNTKLKVVEHIITKNFWEFYVTTDKHSEDIIRCYVVGDFPELGDVSMKEIRPYIITRTSDLSEVMPAPEWQWVD